MIVIFSASLVAQTENDTIQQLQKQIVNLEKLNSRLSKQVRSSDSNIRKLEGRLSSTADSVDIMKKELVITNLTLRAMAKKFELQLQQLSDKSNSDYSALSKRVSNSNLYWILTILSVLVLATLFFGWLKTRFTFIKTELSDQIKNSSESIREEIIKLDNQLFWSLDFQKKQNKTGRDESENTDHSLALKVADEIIRIQKNLSNMDPGTKGVKQLEFAVERIQDNFTENGYELVELLNKPYDQGMKVSAKFKPDPTLKKGEQIITRIIKPQVNYNDIIIQEAQVEVSVGE